MGNTNFLDIRISSNMDSYSLSCPRPEDPSKKNFFSDYIFSISGLKFSKANQVQFTTRDYLQVHSWDMRKPNKPIKSLRVTDYMDRHLVNLYENESIFDKFFVDMSPDGKSILTGSYNNFAHIINQETMTNTHLSVSFKTPKNEPCGRIKNYNPNTLKLEKPHEP